MVNWGCHIHRRRFPSRSRTWRRVGIVPPCRFYWGRWMWQSPNPSARGSPMSESRFIKLRRTVLATLLVPLLLAALSCAGSEPNASAACDAHTSESARRYCAAGESLNAERTPGKSWSDGSNWRDGVSHLPPSTPLEPSANILPNLTCTQWEALNMSVFPEGLAYGPQDWYSAPSADAIAAEWKRNLARAIWGEHPQATKWMERENFITSCGSMMK